jgi:two-component system, OmpR family, sensor histidine kinase KdpD
MSEIPERPNPDALLKRIVAEEQRSKRGKLKVFFGFAPGVGKTYRMLQVARDLVADQKLDLIVGIVETHRRRETAALVLGLELLPRRTLEYRGHSLEEFDLDAALARKPKIVLVDELAHTNVAGARNAKRWQDVLELLDAGIDVFTTMNVQHVESLNDIIAQITRIQVRETVPDSIIDAADSLELVDITPEELVERLREGKVYLPEQASLAIEHFFQRGNLLALRELALRRTAQRVDADMLEYRELQGDSTKTPIGERILVCVGPAPSSGRLIRAAARLAAGLRCPWVAVYAEPSNISAFRDAERARLEAHLRLAESLGATVARLSGGRISDALLAYARRYNVSKIVIGKPTHTRLRDLVFGSLLNEVVRGSGSIDVYVISGDDAPQAQSSREPVQKEAVRLTQYAASTGLIALTLAVAVVLRATLKLPDLEMLFLLTVMITAIFFGRGPSVFAAFLGVAAYDFFFVPPYFTFAVADWRYILTFAMMFGVGFVLSELTRRIRRQQHEAVAREERTAAHYALSRGLSLLDTAEEIAALAARHAADVFDCAVTIARLSASGELVVLGSSSTEATLDGRDLGVAQWAMEHLVIAGVGTDILPGSSTLCCPLVMHGNAIGVIQLKPKKAQPLNAEQRSFLDVFSRQVASALDRVRLAEEARAAEVRAKTEEMRSALLSSVSHDLRTPLASITGAATALCDNGQLNPTTRSELASSICEQAERLERLVTNLLDMTRLQAGAMRVKRDWIPVEELIGPALTRLELKLAERPVRIKTATALPWVNVDPVLFEQVLVNLLENVCKYTPQRSPIDINTRQDGDSIIISVIDYGPGVARGLEGRLFEKFYRGEHIEVSGAGLGLAICRGIVEAHGGRIWAENATGGGLTVHIRVPIGGIPPLTSSDELEA